MRLVRLTSDEFSRAVAGTRIRRRAADIGRMVLVDGLSAKDAAARAGVSNQRVWDIVSRIEKAYEASGSGTPAAGYLAKVVLPAPVTAALSQYSVALETCKDAAARANSADRVAKYLAEEQRGLETISGAPKENAERAGSAFDHL